MALTLDASSPAKATGNGATVVTASFTAPANAFLVAFLNYNTPASTQNNQTVTDSGGLTWTLRGRQSIDAATSILGAPTESGGAEIWTATTASSVSRTVTTTQGASVSRDCCLLVKVFTDTGGAPTAGAIAAGRTNGSAATATLTTTATNSWVWATSADYLQNGLGTAGSGQTISTSDENDVAGQYTGHVWRQTSTTPSISSVTDNLTAPASQQYNEVIFEIVANTAAGGSSGPSWIQPSYPPFVPPYRDPAVQPFQMQGEDYAPFLALADSGAGDDSSFTIAASVPLSDTGAAADGLTVSIDYGLVTAPNQFPPFTAPFIEPNAVPFQLQGESAAPFLNLTDTGAADDSSFTVAAAVPLTDSGAGADTVTIAAAIPLTDTGTAADSLSVLIDYGQVAGAPPFPPFTAPFIDPNVVPFQLQGDASGQTQISLTDSGAATDSITVDTGTDQNQAVPLFAPMFLEPNYGAFQLFGDASGQTQISLTDSGAADDSSLTVTAAVPLSDSGAADDSSLSIAAAVPLTDTGAAADSISVVVSYDPNQASPLPFPAFTAPFIEPSAIPFQLLGDTSAIPQIGLTDSGTADDSSLTITAAVPLSDSGAGSDTATIAAAVPLSDSGSAADTVSVVITGSDSAPPLVFFIPPIPSPFGHPTFVPFQLQGSSEIVIPTAVPPITVIGGSSVAITVAGGDTAPTVTVTGGSSSTITVR